MLRVLVLHGLHGNEPDHWQSWLARELDADPSVDVRYPDLPACDEPCPDRWAGALDRHLRWLGAPSEDVERVVVCHSLACILWLRHAARGLRDAADRVVLVAPPGPGHPELEGFFPHGATPDAVARAARATELWCADDDPWCPDGAADRFGAALRVPTRVVPGGGHLNVDSGLGKWPAIAGAVYGAKNGVEA